MAKIQNLIDKDGNIVYPQTSADATLMEDGTTAQQAILERPKLITSTEEPAELVPEDSIYGVVGETGQITTPEIADGAVTTAKLASSAVTTAKIASSAVTADKLASDAVTTAKILDKNVTQAKLADGAVGTTQISNNAITKDKIANGAVTSDKIDWTTIYPIGSIYFSTNSDNPQTWMSGTTWEAYAAGRVLVGQNPSDTDFLAGKTGGEKTHKLTVSEMPSHTHGLDFLRFLNAWSASGRGSGNWLSSSSYYYGSNQEYNDIPCIGRTASSGSASAHNNLQPYVAVFMWRRIA